MDKHSLRGWLGWVRVLGCSECGVGVVGICEFKGWLELVERWVWEWLKWVHVVRVSGYDGLLKTRINVVTH